jgi:hypothetical protein
MRLKLGAGLSRKERTSMIRTRIFAVFAVFAPRGESKIVYPQNGCVRSFYEKVIFVRRQFLRCGFKFSYSCSRHKWSLQNSAAVSS